MALLHIPSTDQFFNSFEEINSFAQQFGIYYERWENKPLSQELDGEQILLAYEEELERVKKKGGYITADVMDIRPETPGLDEMLARFSKEHTHSEDEVRFCIHGRGIFHINPGSAPVFSIELQAGDLINVPAGTRHWFNLCQEKTIRVIRLFQDKTGWTPHYLEDNVDGLYTAQCFSEIKHSDRQTHKTVVNS